MIRNIPRTKIVTWKLYVDTTYRNYDYIFYLQCNDELFFSDASGIDSALMNISNDCPLEYIRSFVTPTDKIFSKNPIKIGDENKLILRSLYWHIFKELEISHLKKLTKKLVFI